MVLKEAGRIEEALQVFDKAVQLEPGTAHLWNHLGSALAALDRKSDALLSWQHALKLDPQYWEAAYRCGMALQESTRFDEALSYFNICNEVRPNHVPTLQGRARSYRSLRRFEECLTDAMRAHALDQADLVSCNIVGNVLVDLDSPEKALQWFDKAIALQPNLVEVLLNKAGAFVAACYFKEALATYDQVMAIDPNNAKCAFYRSHLQLLTRHFAPGWLGREARWNVPGLPIIYPTFTQPMWLGNEDIKGKTLLVYGDEGFGDTLQFARYVPMLVERGARVILVVLDALYPLLSGIPGIQECRPHSFGFPAAFDTYCPMMSLPLAFGATLTTIPSPAYLPPLALHQIQVWEDRLGAHDRLRVGMVWSGNPNHSNDRSRSVPLRTMASLFDLGATFVSLQKDLRQHDRAFLSERTEVIDLTADFGNFADTAALISCLDLVITVDTSVAHLAATLGCPTWILLPYVPDWRWQLDRDDSPWYSTVRLFRQTSTREYASVIDRVRAALIRQISSRS